VILPISSFYIGRTLEGFYPIRLNTVERPNAGLGREEIDRASDSNAIAGQELKRAVARTDSAYANGITLGLSCFEARDNHRHSRSMSPSLFATLPPIHQPQHLLKFSAKPQEIEPLL
jgi:hypothetical protein